MTAPAREPMPDGAPWTEADWQAFRDLTAYCRVLAEQDEQRARERVRARMEERGVL